MCGSCLKTPPPFAKARSLLFYNALSKKLILQFKHFDALYLAKAFAKWLYATHKSLFEQQDFILPVPLHKKRLLFRRYNQSALIAKELSRLSHIPYNPFLLIRKKNTPSQGTLSKKNRQKNVKNAFETPPKFLKNVKKSNILLIDDVYTTGSTVSVCALSLQKAGVSEITVLTVARATPYFDLK